MKDIRTKRGKLVGKLDEGAGIFSIKDGGKVTLIEIPPQGLRLQFTSGGGIAETIYITSTKETATTKPI